MYESATRRPAAGVDEMWFLPSAPNVKVKKFNEAQVYGRSNYDSKSSQMPRYLISDAHEWMNDGMGNTCKSMADSHQCMTKTTTIL